MADTIDITLVSAPVTVDILSPADTPVSVAVVESAAPVSVAVTASAPAITVAATQPASTPVQVAVAEAPAGVAGPPGPPGTAGPAGTSITTIVLSMAQYLALSPAAQMDASKWYIIPTT